VIHVYLIVTLFLRNVNCALAVEVVFITFYMLPSIAVAALISFDISNKRL